jgi:hypothetical protein
VTVDSRKKVEATPAVQAWRKANPIRKWIDAKPKPRGARIGYLVEHLGVVRYAVYRWMHGVNLPDTARFSAILAIIRCSSATYMKWWNQMPQGEQPCVVQPQGETAVSSSTPRRS